MPDNSYYNIVEGNLHTGDIAKSSDITHIQIHIQDALKNLLDDLHDHQPYLVGSDEAHRYDFLLSPAPKTSGRYIDAINTFTIKPDKFININRYDVRQPIPITKTSVYSIIIQAKNTSNKNIPIECELQSVDGEVLRTNTITLPAETNPINAEIVFDLEYFPTAPDLNYEDLMERDGQDIPPITDENSFDEGFTIVNDHDECDVNSMNSNGVSQLYFVIKRTNLNEIDLYENEDDNVIFNPDESLGVYYTEETTIGDRDIFLETRDGVTYAKSGNKTLWFEEIYANGPTYLLQKRGSAVIDGEKVDCLDSHVSVSGTSENGNVLTRVYLGTDGHLHTSNSKASLTTDLDDFSYDVDDPVPMAGFPIALILTYSNMYREDTGEELTPLIIQDQKYNQLPLSHHERLRRLEKKMDWTTDIAIPSRIKYTLNGEDCIDKTGHELVTLLPFKPNHSGGNNTYYLTTDSNGNVVIQFIQVPNEEVTVDLRVTGKNSKGDKITPETTDKINASLFSSISGMEHNTDEGTLELKSKKVETKQKATVATTKKEAKETEYNPWDDAKANRPTGSKLKKHTREYTVIKGTKGRKEGDKSEFPAMTLYMKNKATLKKLQVPVRKFHNCSGVRFIIWRRQAKNNKTNTVWHPLLEKKLFTSKVFSLKKAEVKGKYQYVNKGFTIDFTKDEKGKEKHKKGLKLDKGQYVIIVLPIPKNKKGSVFIETYKPKNSRDFCIRYQGSDDASYFTLKTRYQEVWYNSAKITVEEEEYEAKGEAVSRVTTFKSTSSTTLTRFTSVKPIIGKNLSYSKKDCDYKLFINTGGSKWQQVEPDKENEITGGGANSFQWKIQFFSKKGKASPVLKYNKSAKNAIKFILKRENAGTGGSQSALETMDKNMCLTSTVIDGNDVLQKYVGDKKLSTRHNKFTQHEFGRIWATEEKNNKLLIDIQASDYSKTYDGYEIPIWTLQYCDLTLSDFSKTNVDYSDYKEDLEPDENNLRFKIDPDHSYNDTDIKISEISKNDFVKNSSNVIDPDVTTNKNSMKFTSNDTTENQTLMKMTLEDKTIDLTKYTGLRFKFNVSVEQNASLKGFGIYISSQKESETPSNIKNLPDTYYNEQEGDFKDEKALPDIIVPGESSESFYDGKIIQITPDASEQIGDYATNNTFYKYVEHYDEQRDMIVYKKEQLHDIRSYVIYRPNTINSSGEKSIRIEKDKDNPNLKSVKEIGFITLNDEGKYEVNKSVTLSLIEVIGISEDYYTIFDPENNVKFISTNTAMFNVFANKSLPFTTDNNYTKYYNDSISSSDHKFVETFPCTTMIDIDRSALNASSDKNHENIVCYLNNYYESGLSDYKHFGIQLAADVYIPKDCLKIELCEETNGREPFVSLNVPTLNTIVDPLQADSNQNNALTITLTQLFKKIDSKKKIRSISIKTTKRFAGMMDEIYNKDSDGTPKTNINLFIGKIVLYKAETIPMFHEKIRFKFYTLVNGQIRHDNDSSRTDSVKIRKIGSVLDYS